MLVLFLKAYLLQNGEDYNVPHYLEVKNSNNMHVLWDVDVVLSSCMDVIG